MTDTTVAILGGGLAGLNAARLLHRAGVDFHLYEARDRLGGRILTVDATGRPAIDGFDLGPSWVWPGMQPDIAALIGELGLTCSAQHGTGSMVFERMAQQEPGRYPTPPQESASQRITGGSGALVSALLARLPADRLDLNMPVRAVTRDGNRLCLSLPTQKITADHVIAAMPPRLMHANIRFAPALAPEIARLWQATPTWMAPHAKFLALYDRPFWREQGLSGMAQSLAGPMAEIHDACTADGQAALFGFLGVSPADRARAGEQALEQACLAQLARLFGPLAGHPVGTLFKDWAADPLTAVPLDITQPGHPEPVARWVDGTWSENLHLAGSETATREPGYLSGAVAASAAAVGRVLSRIG